MAAFVMEMDNAYGKVLGENGAPEHKDTGSALLNLFVKLERGCDKESLKVLFIEALDEATTASQVADLCVLVMQTRNCRGGKGERELFYRLMVLVAILPGTETANALVPLIPHYGYFKDLKALYMFEYLPTEVKEKCLTLYGETLRDDLFEVALAEKEERTPNISLAAKYAPRENSTLDKKAGIAKKLALLLFVLINGTIGEANGNTDAPSHRFLKFYRKALAKLNKVLRTTEVLMSDGRWSEIKFGSVPSLCLQRHRKAFLNEAVKKEMMPHMEATGNRKPDDADRVDARKNLRNAMAANEVKGKQLYPHEIVKKLMYGCSLSNSEEQLMAAQWKEIRQGVKEEFAKAAEECHTSLKIDLGKLVALVDVSGSMHGLPMEVAIALGILVSELADPEFADRILTFESNPTWVDLSKCDDDINKKVDVVRSAPWGFSTDFVKAYERILHVVETAKLAEDAIPDLIVFSDMQFDCATATTSEKEWETHHERLERRFAEVGMKICGRPYRTPRLIYWNLRGDTVGFPVQKDAPNTQMISGFSPALLKLVLRGAAELDAAKAPTPEKTLRMALDDKAYDPVRQALSEVKTGPVAGYVWSPRTEETEAMQIS